MATTTARGPVATGRSRYTGADQSADPKQELDQRTGAEQYEIWNPPAADVSHLGLESRHVASAQS